MSLTSGQTLTHYEILGPLGAGGMGEVYRARDTRLDREVAIKVLPEELAHDEQRLLRFEREAKMLASLNHANVAQVFGIDLEPNGFIDRRDTYSAMGQTSRPGVFVAGAATGPETIDDSIAQATAAAMACLGEIDIAV